MFREAPDRFGIEVHSIVFPCEGMGKELVPGLDECLDGLSECVYGWKTAVPETFLIEYAEPYFDHVEPGPVKGSEVDDDALVFARQPLPPLLSRRYRGVGDPAEVGDGGTKLIVEMGAEIVHDVRETRFGRLAFNMLSENRTKSFRPMVGSTAPKHLAISGRQDRVEVECSISPVIGAVVPRTPNLIRRHRWYQAIQRLNAWALVQTEVVLGRVEVKPDDALHLGEEVGIGDL